MTFSFFFAGRSTLRTLHRTVERNVFRQHLRSHVRQESSSSSSSASNRNTSDVAGGKKGNAYRPFSGVYWAWIEPIKIPFRAYSNMQARSPLLTQWESTLTIYFIGDLSAQIVQTGVFQEHRYEPIQGLRALVIGGLSSIPSYKWFLFLGRHFNYSSHLVSLAVKIVINQSVFAPLFNTYFFGMQSLLSGASLAQTWERVVLTVPTSIKNSWKVWPIVTAFSFTFIKPHNRSVFAGVIAVFWQTYLSMLNRKAELKQQEALKAKKPIAKKTKSKVES